MEWIMIKLRVGQETFCKWGCSSVRLISGRREAARDPFSWGTVLGCRPLIPFRALSCLYRGQKGKYGSISGSGCLVSWATKAGTLASNLETVPALSGEST